jgi:hypothetical protein
MMIMVIHIQIDLTAVIENVCICEFEIMQSHSVFRIQYSDLILSTYLISRASQAGSKVSTEVQHHQLRHPTKVQK